MTEEPRLMTIKEVAAYLRVSGATIYRLMRSGELPSIKFSEKRFTRIRREDLEDFIQRHTIRRRE